VVILLRKLQIFSNLSYQVKGSTAPNNVVLINSAMAIKTICPEKSIDVCIDEAIDSLFGNKAAKVFEKIIE
jgi:anthranilate phosphoribosyltransferase